MAWSDSIDGAPKNIDRAIIDVFKALSRRTWTDGCSFPQESIVICIFKIGTPGPTALTTADLRHRSENAFPSPEVSKRQVQKSPLLVKILIFWKGYNSEVTKTSIVSLFNIFSNINASMIPSMFPHL